MQSGAREAGPGSSAPLSTGMGEKHVGPPYFLQRIFSFL